MSRTPRTDDRYADALASPKHAGDWKYVAEEMARLCRELEGSRATADELADSFNHGRMAGASECRSRVRSCLTALKGRGETFDFDEIWKEVMSCLP